MNNFYELRENIFNLTNHRRIISIDFGTARVGVASCDALHISVSPQKTLMYKELNFWEHLLEIIKLENAAAIVIGVPEIYTKDISQTHKILLEHLNDFISKLESKIFIPIFRHDESFSSKQAVETMLEVGTKKKKRATKGSTDKIAAAIILRNFIEFYNL